MPSVNLAATARRCEECGARVRLHIQRDFKRKRFCSQGCRIENLKKLPRRRGPRADPKRGCSSCGRTPAQAHFGLGKKGARTARCYDCSYAASQLSRNKLYGNGRGHGLVTRYGITEREFDDLSRAQNDLCAICRKKPKRMVVDHDHDTKEIRGLLCDGCNSGLGNLGDSTAGLRRALNYLERASSPG